MKTAFLFAPIMEYSANIRFSVFLNYLKSNQIYDKLVVVCFEKLLCIFPDADEFISVTEEFLIKTKSNYPNLLERFTDRNNSQFQTNALSYINSIKKENDDVLFWDDFKVTKDNGEEVFTEFMDIQPFILNNEFGTEDPLGATYRRDFHHLSNMIEKGFLLKPKKETFERIKTKYNKLFDNENTVIIITRNFKEKQPDDNSDKMIPSIKDFISHLLEKDICVLNIGVPPCHFDFNNINYNELSDDLTQDELLSIMYLSKLTILNFINAGYQTHAISNIDVIKITYEFQGDYIYKGRKNNNNLVTVDFQNEIKNYNFEPISNFIKSHKKDKNLVFSEDKKVILLDKI